MNFEEYFYNFIIGTYPEDEVILLNNKAVIEYITESGLNKKEIIQVLNEMPLRESCEIFVEDIQDKWWDNSLLERDKFYFHKELQITPPPPNLEDDFYDYKEIKIKYTHEDVLNYFYNIFNIKEEWISIYKDLGAVKWILDDYKKFSFTTPVDMLLHLIDYVHAIGDKKITNIYQLSAHEIEFASYFEDDVKNAKSQHKDKVLWRIDAWKDI